MGNIQKIRRSKVNSVLAPAIEPKGPDLHFMDSSSAAAEMVTLCAAAGSVVHYFPTGQGNVIGNPIIPIIKLSGKPREPKAGSIERTCALDSSQLHSFPFSASWPSTLIPQLKQSPRSFRRSEKTTSDGPFDLQKSINPFTRE